MLLRLQICCIKTKSTYLDGRLKESPTFLHKKKEICIFIMKEKKLFAKDEYVIIQCISFASQSHMQKNWDSFVILKHLFIYHSRVYIDVSNSYNNNQTSPIHRCSIITLLDWTTISCEAWSFEATAKAWTFKDRVLSTPLKPELLKLQLLHLACSSPRQRGPCLPCPAVLARVTLETGNRRLREWRGDDAPCDLAVQSSLEPSTQGTSVFFVLQFMYTTISLL